MHIRSPGSWNVPTRAYTEVRSEIRTGDLLLCAGTSVMSRLIQRFTGSAWSHVAIIVRFEEIDRLIVLESVESIGVRAVPLSHYLHDYNGSGRGYGGTLMLARHVAFARMERERLRRMSQFATDVLGRRYDTKEILRIAARIMGERILDPLDGSEGEFHGKTSRDAAYICSEFVWECLRAAGIDIAFDPRGFIAPRDFAVELNVQPLWTIHSGDSPNSTSGYPQS